MEPSELNRKKENKEDKVKKKKVLKVQMGMPNRILRKKNIYIFFLIAIFHSLQKKEAKKIKKFAVLT